MLKKGFFVGKQFKKLLLGGIWGGFAYAVNLMIDSIISGNQLGETALQAVTIVYPLYSVVGFLTALLPVGISVMYGKAIGEFNEKDAHRIAGTGLVASFIISSLLLLGLQLIKMPFLNYYDCSGALLQDALAYYKWLLVYACIAPIGNVIYWLDITDGEAVLFSVAEVGGITVNIVLSLVLSRSLGIEGLGMATAIYSFFNSICYVIHLFKKSNNIKFHFCLDLKVVRKAIVLSFSEYMFYFFVAGVDIVFNRIIIAYCGMEYIPAYSVVNLVFSICEVFITVNNSSIGLITCFLGEQNNHDMNLLLQVIARAVGVISVVITAVFFFGAPLVPVIYGLETPETVQAAVRASRIMAFASLGFGTCYVGGSLSSAVERPLQACFISFLNDALSPLLLSLAFGAMWGFTGIVIGMCLSGYVSAGVYSLVSVLKKGRKGFPIYAENFGNEALSFDLYITPETLSELRDAVGADLKNKGFEVKNVELLLEEFFTRVMEKNPGSKVLAECVLLYERNTVRLIIRDNGVLFNFVDENNRIESMNAYVLNSLLAQTRKKDYLQTVAFNRNGFAFEK